MVLLNKDGWEVAGGVAAVVVAGGALLWLLLRRRPSEQQLEFARRKQLLQYGRLIDGTLIDLCEMPRDSGDPLKLLVFSYRIGGVDYECSQDITHLQEIVDPAQVRLGFPCTVRYQPGNPQNSIVVGEGWTGLRQALPHFPALREAERLDRGATRGE